MDRQVAMPTIEQVPWAYGSGAYYRGLNQPAAVVLHRMQGYRSTARQWALSGHVGASWHYTVGFDGSIMKHLAHSDGGFHAGVNADETGVPTWPLWRGNGVNVNVYTLGVECEGFAGGDWPEAQLASLKWICQRLAGELGVPYDREHFPPHADINIRDRVNDFDTPERRHIVYDYLFKEEDMADPRLDSVIAALGGMDAIEKWNANGNSLLLGFANEQQRVGNLEGVVSAHMAAPHSTVYKGVTPDDIANAITGGAKFAADSIRFAAQRGSGG